MIWRPLVLPSTLLTLALSVAVGAAPAATRQKEQGSKMDALIKQRQQQQQAKATPPAADAGNPESSLQATPALITLSKQIEITLQAAPEEAGKKVTVVQGDKQLGETTLEEKLDLYDNKSAGASILLEFPPIGTRYGVVQIQLAGKRVLDLDLGGLNTDAAFIETLRSGPLRFTRYVFDGDTFPECDYENADEMRRTVSDYKLKIRFFDSSLAEVRNPGRPGRYGAMVEVIPSKKAPAQTPPAGAPPAPRLTPVPRASGPKPAKEGKTAESADQPPPARSSRDVVVECSDGPDSATILRTFTLFKTGKQGGNTVAGISTASLTDEEKQALQSASQGTDEASAKTLACLLDKQQPGWPAGPRQTPDLVDERWWIRLKWKLGIAVSPGHGFVAHLPPGYSPESSKLWPVLFYMHGGGLNHNAAGLAGSKDGLAGLFNPQLKKDFIIIVPAAPGGLWNGNKWFRTFNYVLAKYKVDPNRVSVGGHSMGGKFTAGLAASNGDLFVACIACGGGGISADVARKWVEQRCSGWFFTGELEHPPWRRGAEYSLIAAVDGGHPNIRLSRLPGWGHSTEYYAFPTPQTHAWLVQLDKRNPVRPMCPELSGIASDAGSGDKPRGTAAGSARTSPSGRMSGTSAARSAARAPKAEPKPEKLPEAQPVGIAAPKGFEEMFHPDIKTLVPEWSWYDSALTAIAWGKGENLILPKAQDNAQREAMGTIAKNLNTAMDANRTSKDTTIIYRPLTDSPMIMLDIEADGSLAGRKFKLTDGGRTLVEVTLAAVKDKNGYDIAVASTNIPYPAVGTSYGQLPVYIDNRQIKEVTLIEGERKASFDNVRKAPALDLSSIDTYTYYKNIVETAPFVFKTSVFPGSKLPVGDFAEPSRIESFIGKYKLDFAYFDRDGKPVKAAASPGRYGAKVIIERAGLGGAQGGGARSKASATPARDSPLRFYQFRTLYRTPGDGKAKPEATLEAAGINPSPLSESDREKVVSALTDKGNDDALFLAAIHDRQNGFYLVADRMPPADMARRWWLKTRIANGENVPSPYPMGINLNWAAYAGDKNRKWPVIIYLLSVQDHPLYEVKKQLSHYFYHKEAFRDFLIACPNAYKGQWDQARLLDTVEQILARHNIDPRRVAISGMGYGAGAACELARNHPDLFSCLVLIGSGGVTPSDANLYIRENVGVWLFGTGSNPRSLGRMDGSFGVLLNAGHPNGRYSRVPAWEDQFLPQYAFSGCRGLLDWMLVLDKSGPCRWISDDEAKQAGEIAASRGGRSQPASAGPAKSKASMLGKGKPALGGKSGPAGKAKPAAAPANSLYNTAVEFSRPAPKDWADAMKSAPAFLGVWYWYDTSLTLTEWGRADSIQCDDKFKPAAASLPK